MNKTTIPKLVEEFEAQVGLSPTEARRSAFIAIAAARGWNNARIGRYLGVHRQRISQKMDKYQAYIDNNKMPTLTAVMALVGPRVDTKPGVVAFSQDDWENEQFAQGMLELLVSLEPRTKAA